LKKIALIFIDSEQNRIVEVFQESIAELDKEITALNTIRDILRIFVSRLNESVRASVKLDLLDDAEIINVIETLTLSKINFKEARSMDDLNKANETLNKLNDVRILHLPPCTVAASHFIGPDPELNSGNGLMDFIKKVNLYKIKPDARVFGFNHPNPSQNRPDYGYEFWVTIPDELDVPAPLGKKHFEGGLYAAHCIKMGDFHEWEWLCKWAERNSEYLPNYSDKGEEIMGSCLEEHLNFVFNVMEDNKKWPGNDSQLDLLLPVKFK
jgi:DNA gyrase inhibitor GyrI